MLRRAVIKKLMDSVQELNGQAYEAFLAGPSTPKPYATVKLSSSRGAGAISYAGAQPVEVRIYNAQGTFKSLDGLESSIISSLNGAEITDQVDNEKYCLEWVPGGGDFADEEKRLIGRLIVFEAAALAAPGE